MYDSRCNNSILKQPYEVNVGKQKNYESTTTYEYFSQNF